MLKLVTGRSGSGKTEYLRNYFSALSKAGEQKLFFIVPDQNSFEYESEFLALLGPALSQNILVLGFSRLCDYVFERTGNRFSAFADEGIRHVVMRMALDEVSSSLELFSKRASKEDLCTLMLSAVKEYKKCGVTPDMLRETAEQVSNDTLKKKLTESALVYDAYAALMEKSYMDPLDSLTKAAAVLRSEKLFSDSVIAVDSFYGFTAQEYAVLEELMKQSREMSVALCTETGSAREVFSVTERTRKRLLMLAKENAVTVSQTVSLDESYRLEDEALKAIERQLYVSDKIPFQKNTGSVSLYCAQDGYDECDFIGRNIRKLIEGGYRYRDIAVLIRSDERYQTILPAALEKYHISYFMDQPYPIDSFPIVRFVTAAFRIASDGFERDELLFLLKTGLTSYSVEEIADFENYLFIWDIDGRRLSTPFLMNPRGFSEEFSDEDRQKLQSIESLRSDVVGKLLLFRESSKDATALEISKALMKLLFSLKVRENIDLLCDRFEEDGRADLSAELVRLWNVMCDILDKMVAAIGSYRISSLKFSELLYTYFSNTEISSIPRGLDQVDVALSDRAQLSEKKIVFVMGAVEDEFPHNPVEAGVFTDSERVELIGLDLSLSDDIAQLYQTERYYVYRALTLAAQRLFVSYPSMSEKGEKLAYSSIIEEIKEILPFIQADDALAQPIFEHLYSKKAAFEYYISRYRSHDESLRTLRAYFEEDADYAPTVRSIGRTERREPHRIRDKTLSKALFSKNHFLSSSQVDRYHLCRFEYFCRYGLSVKERRKASIDALEYGTMMHYVMEHFFSRHRNNNYSELEKSDIEKEVSALLDEYLSTHLGGKEAKNQRFLYLYYRIRKTALNLVLRIVEELAQSAFRPADFELSIGQEIKPYTLKLSDGSTIMIRGSVDRVDTYEKDGVTYIRIIDYKTGKKEFRLSDILYGLNLQMLIYLSAIEANGREKYGDQLTPAGVLYMPAVSPAAKDSDGENEAEIIKKMRKEYTMRGIVLEDREILCAMDKELLGRFIPVTLQNDELKGGESLASLEQIGALFRRVDELITDMAQSLFEGEISALPAKGSGFDACNWCPYHSVCTRREADPVREITKLEKEDVYAQLMGEEGAHEHETVDRQPD